jgi:hypothetical protein
VDPSFRFQIGEAGPFLPLLGHSYLCWATPTFKDTLCLLSDICLFFESTHVV